MTTQRATDGQPSQSDVTVVYASLTGNTKRLMDKLAQARPEWQIIRIQDGVTVNQPFHLVTFTTGVGQVPALVERFLQQHRHLLQSVTVSGNMNWPATTKFYNKLLAK